MIASALVASLASGQTGSAIHGRIVSRDGGDPVAAALVGLSSASVAQSTRSRDDGTFAFVGLAPGRYTLTVRRIGFVPREIEVSLNSIDTVVTVILDRAATNLETFKIGGGPGLYGYVVNQRDIIPIAGSQVDVIGIDRPAITDSMGRYALALPKAGRYLVRISHRGHTPFQRWMDVGRASFTALDVALELSESAKPDDAALWREFNLRSRFKGIASALIPESELRNFQKASLTDALRSSPSLARAGLRIGEQTCVFVNGRPAPNWPLAAFDVSTIDAVELYADNADRTGTLAMAWPSRKQCGSNQTINPDLSSMKSAIAAFAVIWLRP